MSKTCVTYPIVAALCTAEELIKPMREWTTSNTTQAVFLNEFFYKCCKEISKIPEIESIASWSAEEINTFLKERGFDIQLEPLNKSEFGVASVLDILVEWVKKGDVTSIRKDGKSYPAVKIDGKYADFFKSTAHNNPIVCLPTKSTDLVYMTILDNAPDGFELIEKIEALSKGVVIHDFGGVVFPMVKLDQKGDISWLKGMRTRGEDGQLALITQALQQIKLRMNEEGARAQSAVAVAVLKGCPLKRLPDYIIDRPFLFWITRPGLNKPLFVAYVTEEDWKNPGDIRSM